MTCLVFVRQHLQSPKHIQAGFHFSVSVLELITSVLKPVVFKVSCATFNMRLRSRKSFSACGTNTFTRHSVIAVLLLFACFLLIFLGDETAVL